jgi:hypothetical protein
MDDEKMKPIFFLLFLSLFLVSCSPFAIINDHMQYYDDFKTGFRDDLWTKNEWCQRYGYDNAFDCSSSYKDVTISGEGLNVNSFRDSCNNIYHQGEVVSKRKFSTEDIKISYKGSYSKVGCITQFVPSISYGNVVITKEDMLKTLSGNCDQSNCAYTGEGIIEIKRYDDLDLTKFVVLIDGVEIKTGINTQPESIIIKGGNLLIKEVKYEPYYSCNINYETEVVVRDKFNAGSSVSLKTLTYTPLKFCPQDLGVLIFSNEGLTDEKGSITEGIAQGQTLTVPANQYWQVDYVTKYVDNMNERCNKVGSVYDTTQKKCVDVVAQQVSTPKLLYCSNTEDCLIPNNCADATVNCVSNQCDYASTICSKEQIINYVEVIKTLEIQEPKIIVLKETNNNVIVNIMGKKNIAGKEFIAGIPVAQKESPNCQVTRGEYLSPSRLGCYSTHIIWGEYNFDITNGETKKLSDYLSITYTMEGRGAYNGEKRFSLLDENNECYTTDSALNADYEFLNTCPGNTDYNNVFTFTFNNIFDIKVNNYKNIINLNSQDKIELSITNNIFNLQNSGYMFKSSQGMLDIFSATTDVPLNFNSGVNIYNVGVPTDTVGVYQLEITPYFYVTETQKYISDNKLVVGYYVSDSDITGTTIKNDKFDIKDYLSEGIVIAILAGILILVVLIGIILFLLRKR